MERSPKVNQNRQPGISAQERGDRYIARLKSRRPTRAPRSQQTIEFPTPAIVQPQVPFRRTNNLGNRTPGEYHSRGAGTAERDEIRLSGD